MGGPKQASGAGGHRTISITAEADDCPVCWICLDGPGPERPLVHPCRCPSWCHAPCIARWQLQSAGTRRETQCDFCCERLPDWKDVLTPNSDTTSAPAVMNVNFDNRTYSFTVSPGMDGYRQFTEAIRRAFHLPHDSELNITFTCDEPSSGSLLTLSGPGAYDAAVHCAAVSAARRLLTNGGPDASGAPAMERAASVARGPAAAGPGCPTPPPVPAPLPLPAQHQAPRTGSGGRAPRRHAGTGGSGSGSSSAASTSAGSSPARRRLEHGESAVAHGPGGAAADAAPSGRRDQGAGAGGGGGVSLGRKLRNALTDMLVMR